MTVEAERWPLASAFVIARGAKTQAEVATVTLAEGASVGRGECVPYGRYGETMEGVLDQIRGFEADLAQGADRAEAARRLPPGAARNAVDCALWDLEAKLSALPVWRLAGLAPPNPVTTAVTLSLAAPEAMARAALAVRARPLLKLKLAGSDDLARVQAVRQAAPSARLIVDANESLSIDGLAELAPGLAALGVECIEQPLRAGEDAALEGFICPVLLCADESAHSAADLPACRRRYGAVNIKLDKAGGLTEALAMKAAAEAMGLKVMAGCMVATSLAMAPAVLVAQGAAYVDLDGPLLLSQDRRPGLRYDGSVIAPPPSALWG